MHLKCFCWAKKHMQTINSSSVPDHNYNIHARGRNFFCSTNTQSKFSLHDFFALFLSPSSHTTRSLCIENEFFLLPINCFLLNPTQQLKFFRCRFEIVVLCATCGFYFFSRVSWTILLVKKKGFKLWMKVIYGVKKIFEN